MMMTLTMNLAINVLCFIASLSTLQAATFDPSLRLISCTRNNLVVKVTGAADDGLIYIQGQGEECKQATSSVETFHEFDFSSCNIEWAMLFRVIIQKSRNFQTGADKQIPVMCVADTSDVVVGNFLAAGDKGDDAGLNKTIKPDAFMSFFKVMTGEEVSGSEVKLTDSIIMVLQLQQSYSVDFDIRARYCVAADIVLVDDFCAVDLDLFGNFWKIRQGHLLNEFKAFRKTDFNGGSVVMNFSCILQLCQGPCLPDQCEDGAFTGWGRKRRDIDRAVTDDVPTSGDRIRRQSPLDVTIDVGGSLNVVEKYSKIKILTTDDFCWDKLGISILITFMCFCITAPSIGSVLLYRKLKRCQEDLDDALCGYKKPTVPKTSAACILNKT